MAEFSIPIETNASGDLSDSKFMEGSYSLGAAIGATFKLEVDANAIYFDVGSTALGEVQFTVDDCHPFFGFRVGLFFRTHRFKSITFKNLTAVAKTGHFIYSRNPNFLVMQFTP